MVEKVRGHLGAEAARALGAVSMRGLRVDRFTVAVAPGWAYEVAGVANDLLADGSLDKPEGAVKLKWAPQRSPEDKARMAAFVPAVRALEHCLQLARASAELGPNLVNVTARPEWREWAGTLVGEGRRVEVFRVVLGQTGRAEYEWSSPGLAAIGLQSGAGLLARAPARR